MYERSDKMKRKLILLSTILFWVFIMTGCWNSKELNTLGIVTAIGVDWKDKEILVTAEVINPRSVKGMSEAKPEELVKYVQGRGDTIFEAFRNIASKLDRRIFLSQNKVFIFGEEFAKRGLTDYMDLFQRDEEFRETSYILIAKGKQATDVMGVYGGIEEVPGVYMEDIIKNKRNNAKLISINISEYLKYYYDSGRQPILGVVYKEEKDPISKPDTSKGKKEYELIIEGSSVFSREKLVGYLTAEETRALNFVGNRIEGGIIEFPTPITKVDSYSTPTPQTEGLSSDVRPMVKGGSVFQITKSKTKNNIDIVNGKLILNTKVKMKGIIGEVIGDIDISKEEAIKLMEEHCSRQVQKEIENTIKKVQKEYKIDIFGFGSLMHRKYPEKWHGIKNDWDNIFSETDIKVEVETNIIRTGLVNTPTNKIRGE